MNIKAFNDEKELLLKVAKGDEYAFRELFETYHNRLYFYTLQITTSREMAEDITQDTFLKIWLRRNLLPTIEHFNSYLFQMAQNAVLNGLRRKATEAAILNGSVGPASPDVAPDDMLHVKLVREILQKEVDHLPIQQKKVYTLCRMQGYSIPEVARNLDISVVTVKRHLGEAQKTLRKAILATLPCEAGVVLIIVTLFNYR